MIYTATGKPTPTPDGGWIPTTLARPNKGQSVEWIAPSGGEPQPGTYQGVWMLPSGMYVYYTPVMWRPLKEIAK